MSKYRTVMMVISLLFLAAAFICGLADDTPDNYLFVSLIAAAGVFAFLRD